MAESELIYDINGQHYDEVPDGEFTRESSWKDAQKHRQKRLSNNFINPPGHIVQCTTLPRHHPSNRFFYPQCNRDSDS